MVERIWWVLWNDICRCPREIESVLSQSKLAARIERSVSGASASGWVPSWGQGTTVSLQLSTTWSRSRKRAKWVLEDNTAWYGQEKKLWVSRVDCFRLPLSPSVYLSFIPQKVWSLSRIKCERYILYISRCYGHSSFPRQFIIHLFIMQIKWKIIKKYFIPRSFNSRCSLYLKEKISIIIRYKFTSQLLN